MAGAGRGCKVQNIRALTIKGWCEMYRCRKVLNIGGGGGGGVQGSE